MSKKSNMQAKMDQFIPGLPDDADGTKKQTVRELAEQLLLSDPPLSTAQIVAAIQAAMPDAKTTGKCIRYYASKMRKHGVALPPRHSKPMSQTTE